MQLPRDFLQVKITTPTIELVVADEELLHQLGESAARGVSDAARPSPFRTGWDRLPPSERANHIIERQRHHWLTFTPSDWQLPFVICVDQHPIGEITLRGADLNNRSSFATASWLGLAHQKNGYGTEARLAALQFGFTVLGAELATSMSFADNTPSQNISRSLGYTMSGASTFPVPPCSMRRLIHYRLGHRIWESRHKRPDIEILNADAVIRALTP